MIFWRNLDGGLRCVCRGSGALVLGWRLKKLLVVLRYFFIGILSVFPLILALVWEKCGASFLERKKKISEKCLSLSKNLGRRSRPSPKSLLIKTQKHCKQDGHVRHHRRHPPTHHDRCVPPVVGSRPGARGGWYHGLDDGALPPPLVPRLLCARIPACGSSVQNNDPRP